jgi:nucleotide-binding universal stress UspA family protein
MDVSQTVAKKAMLLSLKYNMPLDVLHIEEESFFEFLKEKKPSYLENCKETLQRMYAGVNARVFCKYGNVMQIIQDHIEQNGITAIVAGFKRKRTFLQDITEGSHLDVIIRKTNLPVLVIKTEDEPNYKNILIPTDLSKESKQNIEYLAKLLPDAVFYIEHYYHVFFENRLSLYGFDKNDSKEFMDYYKYEAIENLKKFIQELSLPASIRIHYKVAQYLEINTLIRKSIAFNDIDLLSLSTSGFVSIFSFDLLEHSSKDVIIFKVH